MARKPDAPCVGCGKMLWGGKTSLPAGERRCRECRHSYASGCRCSECRASAAAKQRKFAANLKARTGRSVRSHYPDGSERHWISLKRRVAVYERDDWMCWLCGELVDRGAHYNANRAPSLDHVIPRSKGGSHDEDNLRCAHRICNGKRGASDAPEEHRSAASARS